MTTDLELEDRLRRTLAARAEEITEHDLTVRSLQGLPLAARRASTGRPSFVRPVAVAAVTIVVLAAVGYLGLSRDPAARPDLDTHRPPATAMPATTPDGGGVPAAAWPLTSDQPLPGPLVAADVLRTPESAAREYLASVVRVPRDWPIAGIAEDGDRATVSYVLQDVPAQIDLARAPDTGLWFVTRATTEHVSVGTPVVTEDGLGVSVGPGPRTYESGARIRLTVVAADGSTVGTAGAAGSVVPPRRRGQAAAAPVSSVRWGSTELAAAVRVDVIDDHDGNPDTPAATVGHATVAIPAPTPVGMPAGFDVRTAMPVFAAPGGADDVVQAYLRSRFPDFPAPQVRSQPARTRAGIAVARWTTGGSGDGPIASGSMFLRRGGDGTWAVIASTTDGVDVSGVMVEDDGTVSGQIRSTNDNSLFADVLTPTGEVVAGAPRPQGHPGAAYRFGTAAGPANRLLDVDVPKDGGPAVLRVSLVGGTILSITEVALP